MRTHLHAYARCIYIHEFRTGIGLRVYLPSCPSWMPHAFPVRQASVLHAASFGFRLATDTLAVQLTVPPVGPVEDFHLRVGAPCRAHKKKAPLGVHRGGLISTVLRRLRCTHGRASRKYEDYEDERDPCLSEA